MEVYGSKIRWRCESSPPPDLKKVLKALAKVARCRPLRGNQEVRSLATSVSREYNDKKGYADDLARFLFTHEILLFEESKNEMYYDPERAAVILAACEEHRRPPPPIGTRAERLARLMSQMQAADNEPDEEPMPVSGTHPPVSSDRTPPAPEIPVMASDTGEETEMPIVIGSDLEAAGDRPTLPESATMSFRAVLHLTPVEYEVWDHILVSVIAHDDHHVSVPRDNKLFHHRAQPHIACSPETFRRAFDRFVEHDLLEEFSGNRDFVSYRPTRPLEEYLVELIPSRAPLPLNANFIEAIRKHQTGFLENPRRPSRQELVKLLQETSVPLATDGSDNGGFAPLMSNLEWLYLGLPPKEANSSCAQRSHGLFCEQADGWLVSMRGFEPFELFDWDENPCFVTSVYRIRGAKGTSRLALVPTNPNREWLFDQFGQQHDWLESADMLAAAETSTLSGLRATLSELQSRAEGWLKNLGGELEKRTQREEAERRRVEERRSLERELEQMNREEEEAARKIQEARQRRAQLEERLKSLKG